MQSRVAHLRVKIKSLSAEIVMINHEVNRARNFKEISKLKSRIAVARNGDQVARKGGEKDLDEIAKVKTLLVKAKKYQDWELFWSNWTHGRYLGYEVRHSLLAYAFLRGRPYSRIEASCHKDNKPNFDYVCDLVSRFGAVRSFESLHDPNYIERAQTNFPEEMYLENRHEETVNSFNIRQNAQKHAWENWREEAEVHLRAVEARRYEKQQQIVQPAVVTVAA